MRLLDNRERSAVAERYEHGVSVNELAADYGINRQTIAAILYRQGVATRYRLLDKVTVTAAAELYAEGLSLAGVAARLNVSTKTINNAFREVDDAIKEAPDQAAFIEKLKERVLRDYEQNREEMGWSTRTRDVAARALEIALQTRQ